MPTNQIPDVKLFRDKINWKWILFGLIVFRFVVIPAFLYFKEKTNKVSAQPNKASYVSLPDNFDEIELPAQVGCWRLKLDPDKFSGKVWFPRGRRMSFYIDWEDKNSVGYIKNKPGKLFEIDPKNPGSLGTSHDNEVLQFKGNGHVKIYILRIWSPMQQF